MSLVYASSDVSLEPYVHTCLQILGIGLFYLYNMIEASVLFCIYYIADLGVYFGLISQEVSENFLSLLMNLFYMGLEKLDAIMDYLFSLLHSYIYIFNSVSLEMSTFLKNHSYLNIIVDRDILLLIEYYI